MKQILSILLGIILAAYSSIALASDTTTIWVTKASDTTAKVCTDKACLGTVPVKFADGTTWNDVKDSYDVSSNTENAIGNKGGVITIHGDGGISVTCTKACAPKKDKESSKAADSAK